MPKITFIEHDGAVHTVEAELDHSVMETALRHGVSSIVAECGGGCTCATCHVYVDEAWLEKVGPPVRARKRNSMPPSRWSEFAPVLPDQGDARTRRTDRAHAVLSGAVIGGLVILVAGEGHAAKSKNSHQIPFKIN